MMHDRHPHAHLQLPVQQNDVGEPKLHEAHRLLHQQQQPKESIAAQWRRLTKHSVNLPLVISLCFLTFVCGFLLDSSVLLPAPTGPQVGCSVLRLTSHLLLSPIPLPLPLPTRTHWSPPPSSCCQPVHRRLPLIIPDVDHEQPQPEADCQHRA